MEQAADIEARCLDVLDWRLGPFFLEDDLTGEAGTLEAVWQSRHGQPWQ